MNGDIHSPQPRTYSYSAKGGKKNVKGSKDPKKRILLIDDDDDTLFWMRDMLESDDYEVDLADSGAEGILRFRRLPPDLVILDIEMPGMNGYEVCQKLRQIDQDPYSRWHRGWRNTFGKPSPDNHVPIVFLTGHATPDHVRGGIQSGVDDYIVKTNNKPVLLAKIKKFFQPPEPPMTNKDIKNYFDNIKSKPVEKIEKRDEKPPVATPPPAETAWTPDHWEEAIKKGLSQDEPPIQKNALSQSTPPGAAAESKKIPVETTRPIRGSGLVESQSVDILTEPDALDLTAAGQPLQSEKAKELRGWLIQMFSDPKLTEEEIVDIDAEYETLMASREAPPEPITDKVREMTHRFGPKLTNLLGFSAVPGECRLRLLDGGLRVELDIDPPTGLAGAATVDQVQELLEKRKIVFGIDEEEIEKAVEKGKTHKVQGICIAKGIPPENGEDGRIEIVGLDAISHPVS